MADDKLLTLTADIVAAHVGNNHVAAGSVPELITAVYGALSGAVAPAEPTAAVPQPAVPIRSSVKPDYIVSLEDGAKLKMLKRYLKTRFDMTPEQYRAKWGLPSDYPMIAPNYAQQRRALAHAIGLGKKAVATAENAVEEMAAPVAQAVKAGRKKLGIVAAKAAAIAHLGGGDADAPKRTRKSI